ncbi:uncharacterized protein PgNI_09172 [Pyricularia grisea]|uniref:Uncharacterized protein n=1 Tax=Pyricularia grisea TaxID=148305 RepID=A0A6P8ASX1_PYRGI|nr:uncharacterized protein PgNI_09172 [Pyricularia grisea]TLD05197.1 hypothetical protein PgNI_09172 [Pyricularia grisea]
MDCLDGRADVSHFVVSDLSVGRDDETRAGVVAVATEALADHVPNRIDAVTWEGGGFRRE